MLSSLYNLLNKACAAHGSTALSFLQPQHRNKYSIAIRIPKTNNAYLKTKINNSTAFREHLFESHWFIYSHGNSVSNLKKKNK